MIGDNETGFRGTGDDAYRMEAWEFVLAGGGLYNNLDYSFAAGHEDGTFAYPAKQPGGGNPGFRRQMKILREFIDGFDFVRMGPTTRRSRSASPAMSRMRSQSPARQWRITAPSEKPTSSGTVSLQVELAEGTGKPSGSTRRPARSPARNEWTAVGPACAGITDVRDGYCVKVAKTIGLRSIIGFLERRHAKRELQRLEFSLQAAFGRLGDAAIEGAASEPVDFDGRPPEGYTIRWRAAHAVRRPLRPAAAVFRRPATCLQSSSEFKPV